jgi:hypothetical protein
MYYGWRTSRNDPYCRAHRVPGAQITDIGRLMSSAERNDSCVDPC